MGVFAMRKKLLSRAVDCVAVGIRRPRQMSDDFQIVAFAKDALCLNRGSMREISIGVSKIVNENGPVAACSIIGNGANLNRCQTFAARRRSNEKERHISQLRSRPLFLFHIRPTAAPLRSSAKDATRYVS